MSPALLFLFVAMSGATAEAAPSPNLGSTAAACDNLYLSQSAMAHAHDAQRISDDEAYLEKIHAMQNKLQPISALAMLPDTTTAEDQTRDLKLLLLLERLENAVTAAESGRFDTSRQLLAKADFGSNTATLQRLTDFWGCQREEGDVQIQEVQKEEPEPAEAPLADPRSISAGRGGYQKEDSSGHPIPTDTDSSSFEDLLQGPTEEQAEQIRLMTLALFGLSLMGLLHAYRSAKSIRSIRQPCHITTAIQVHDDQLPVRVLNISKSGAKMETMTDDTPPDHFLLFLAARWRRGRIRWRNQHYLGVSFTPQLKDSELSAILAAHCYDESKRPAYFFAT